MTSFTPFSPRRTRSRRKVDQNGSASLGSMCSLTISRLGAGADEAVDVGLHDDLQHALGDAAQEIAVSDLCHELGKALPSEVEGR